MESSYIILRTQRFLYYVLSFIILYKLLEYNKLINFTNIIIIGIISMLFIDIFYPHIYIQKTI